MFLYSFVGFLYMLLCLPVYVNIACYMHLDSFYTCIHIYSIVTVIAVSIAIIIVVIVADC